MCVQFIVHNCCTQYCTEQGWYFPSYPPDNHHCSDDVYLRERGETLTILCKGWMHACSNFHFFLLLTINPSQTSSWRQQWLKVDTEPQLPQHKLRSKVNGRITKQMKTISRTTCHRNQKQVWRENLARESWILLLEALRVHQANSQRIRWQCDVSVDKIQH